MRIPCVSGLLLASASVFAVLSGPADAQITTDGTTPTTCNGGACNGSTGNILIDGGVIAGSNQFHSFVDFNIADGDSASFGYSGASTIENIITRVTGGNISTINGSLSANVDGASLFFVNPNGVVFGETSSVDVSGSFYLSTADELVFENEDSVAMGSATSTFSAAAPEEFGFLSSNASSIVLNGNGPGNEVFEGGVSDFRLEQFHIAAPNVALDGLTILIEDSRAGTNDLFPGAAVSVVGTQNGEFSANSVSIQVVSSASDTRALGEVTPPSDILIDEFLSVSMTDSIVATSTTGRFAAGQITVGANQIDLSNSRIASHSYAIPNFSNVLFPTDVGGVRVFGRLGAEVVFAFETPIYTGATGSVIFRDSDNGGSQILFTSPGGGAEGSGDINLSANHISLIEGSQLDSISFGLGPTAAINLSVQESLEIDDSSIASFINPVVEDVGTELASGAGSILITGSPGASAVVSNGSNIVSLNSSTGTENAEAGVVSISGFNGLIVDASTINGETTGSAAGSGITLDASNIFIQNGSTISSATTRQQDPLGAATIATGDGGFILVDAGSNLTIQDSFVIATTAEGSSGDGGVLGLTAGDTLLIDGSTLNASTGSGSTGAGGIMTIFAPNIGIVDDLSATDPTKETRIQTSTGGTGNAGALQIFADSAIAILGLNTSIETNSLSEQSDSGDAGFIELRAPTLSIRGADLFSTSQGGGDAGTININVFDTFYLENSIISSSSSSEEGFAGSAGLIEILANDFDAFGALLTTQAVGGGAGSIEVVALDQFNMSESRISTEIQSSTGGANGNGFINLTALDLTIHNSFIETETLSNEVGTGAGSVQITAQNLALTADEPVADDGTVRSGTLINTATLGAASAGSVLIDAFSLYIENASIQSATSGDGEAGDISINVGSLKASCSVDSFASCRMDSSTIGRGNAGRVDIGANDIHLDGYVLGSNGFAEGLGNEAGNAGSVTILAEILEMTNDAAISTLGIENASAGDIDLFVSKELRLSSSAIGSTSDFGSPGLISIDVLGSGGTGDVSLMDGSRITTNTIGGIPGVNESGIEINVGGDLSLSNSTIFSQSESSNAGTITIVGNGAVSLRDGSEISTNSDLAQAGEISVSVGPDAFLTLIDSQITTSGAPELSGQSTGGTISVLSTGEPNLFDNEAIAAFLSGEPQDYAGAILIGSTLEALGDGSGALISIERSGLLLIDGGSTIAVSGTFDAPDSEISDNQENLDSDFLDAGNVLASQCAVQQAGESSALSLNPKMGLNTIGGLEPSPLRGPQFYGDQTSAEDVNDQIREVIKSEIQTHPCA